MVVQQRASIHSRRAHRHRQAAATPRRRCRGRLLLPDHAVSPRCVSWMARDLRLRLVLTISPLFWMIWTLRTGTRRWARLEPKGLSDFASCYCCPCCSITQVRSVADDWIDWRRPRGRWTMAAKAARLVKSSSIASPRVGPKCQKRATADVGRSRLDLVRVPVRGERDVLPDDAMPCKTFASSAT